MTVKKAGIDTSMPDIDFSVYDFLPSGVVITSSDLKVVYVNKKFIELTEITSEVICGKPIWKCFSRVERVEFEKFFLDMRSHFTKRAIFESSFIRISDGQPFSLLWEIIALKTKDGFEGFIASSSNISEHNQQTKEKLTDIITGLPNFAVLESELNTQIIKYNQDQSHFFNLMVVDVDRYKLLCYENSHVPNFDEIVLKKVSQRLVQLLGSGTNDIVCRLGDDRFFILVDFCKTVEDTKKFAEIVREKLSVPYLIGGIKINLTVSLGVSYPHGKQTSETSLFREANYSLLAAKKGKKNQVVIFDLEMQKTLDVAIRIELSLREALADPDNWFVVEYMPIVDLETGLIVSFEALIRKRIAGSIDLQSPAQFIAIAEQNNLIMQIDHWVMGQAGLTLQDWNSKFPDVGISVNLASQHFHTSDVAKMIHDLGMKLGIDVRKIKIEVTESMEIRDPIKLINQLMNLDSMSVEAAVDDFGAGYNGLRIISDYDFHVIKTDMSLITGVLENPKKKTFFDAIMGFCNTIDKKVIVEGVSDEKLLVHIMKMDCRYAQGFVFSPSVDKKQAENYLRTQPFVKVVQEARKKMSS